MGKFKIIFTVCLTVLSFHVRKSQLRSLEDDKSGTKISNLKNIEDWNTEKCVCFPQTATGRLVSQYFTLDDEQERLVVYFYKSKLSNKLNAYIPSWKKQTLFPDLTFNLGDKFESVVPEGISDLLSSVFFTKTLEDVDVIPVSTLAPDRGSTVTENISNAPYFEILNTPTSGNQHENDNWASPTYSNPITLVHNLPNETKVPDKTYADQQNNHNEHQAYDPISSVEGLPDEIKINPNTYKNKQERDNDVFVTDFDPIPLVHILPDKTDNSYANQQKNNNEAWHQDFNPITLVERPPDEIKIPTNTYKNTQEIDNETDMGLDTTTFIKGFPDETKIPTNTYKNKQEHDDNALLTDLDSITLVHVLPDKTNVPNKTYANQQQNDTDAFLSDLDPISSVPILPDETNVPDNTYANQQENNNEAWHQDFNLINLMERPPNEMKIPKQENNNDVLLTDFDPITVVHILPDKTNVPDNYYANYQESGIGTSAKGLNLINLAKHNPDEINISDNLSKPGTNGKNTLITSPKDLSQSHNNNLKQNFNLPFWQPNHSIKGTLIDNNGSNMPIDALPGLGGLVKYIPGYEGLSAPLKSHNPGLIDITAQSRPTDSKTIEYLSSKYEHPIFNSWLSKQWISILSNRPFMSNAINLHLLRRLLIKALYENGIHLSRDGDLYDSNGNVLSLENLKLRPILLSDPLEYEKLIASKKCVIPYNIPYLEAVIVTLVYPPRILAIIPLGLRNDIISSSQGSITPDCGQSTCHEAFRLGLPEKEELTEEINEKLTNKENHKKNYESKETLGEPAEYSNNRKARNNYPYMAADTNVLMEVGSTPEAVTIPKDYHLGFLEYTEPTSQRRAYADKLNEENYEQVQERSSELFKELESIDSNDDINNDSTINLSPGKQIKHGGKIKFFDEGKHLEDRKSLEDYDVLKGPEQKPEDDDDDDMLTIRIVGGNPATSSGTPVSSKGRSGWGP